VNRHDIERQDFPAARRGYDAAAVHEHLRRVADEFEALAARPQRASLAEGASTQVRAIIEAAESSAQRMREDAGREASDHVERVGNAAKDLLGKLDRLQGELDRLLGGLRSTAEGLTGSLDELSREVGTLGAPLAAGPVEPALPEPAAPAAPSDVEPARAAANGARSGDEAGARLVALNMALEDRPREEAARYLGEHFELADVEALLDDVYSSAGR
jgi:DivIVA domain-containing protein